MNSPSQPKVSLWHRLIRKRVIQTLLLYIPIGWIFIEIITAATENFALPSWIPGGVMILFIAGLPVVLFLSWAFQWTENGFRTEVKSWKGGLVVTVAVASLLGFSLLLLQNMRQESQLVNSIAERLSKFGSEEVLVQPVSVLAVLPFEKEEDANSKLATTFTAEIAARLAKYSDLSVLSSGTTYSPLLASMIPVRQRQLQTDHVVTGLISTDDQSHRLKIKLEDKNQAVLWQEEMRFGDDAESQRGLQRRISIRIAELLGSKARSMEYCEPTENLDALEAYHQARLKMNQKGPDNLAQAVNLSKKAIALDPEYGYAYEALGLAYLLQHNIPLAVDTFRQALSKCATLGVAYKVWVPTYEGINNEWIDQELQFRDALAMSPNDLWILDNYSHQLVKTGRIDAARAVIRRSYRNNPLQPRVIVTYAWMEFALGDTNSALSLADEAESLGDESCNVELLRLVASTFVSEAAVIKAHEATPERCLDSGLEDSRLETVLGLHAARTNIEARKKKLKKTRAEIEEKANWAMIVGIELSDLDLAFDAFDIGFEQRQYGMSFDSWWAQRGSAKLFRQDPRFVEVVERQGLHEYWREFGWPAGMCTPLGDSFVCDN